MERCSPWFSARCCTWMSLDGPVRWVLGCFPLWVHDLNFMRKNQSNWSQVKAHWRVRNGYLCWNLGELCLRPCVTYLTAHAHPCSSVKPNWHGYGKWPICRWFTMIYPLKRWFSIATLVSRRVYHRWLMGFPNTDYKSKLQVIMPNNHLLPHRFIHQKVHLWWAPFGSAGTVSPWN